MRSKAVAIFVLLALILSLGCGLTTSSRKQRYYNKGLAYEQKAKYAEASIEFLNAIQLDPLFTPAHYELAKVALKLGDTETSRLEFQTTVDRDPSNLDAHVQLANLQVKRGDIQDARKNATLVLGKNPNDAGAHAVMSWVDAADKNLDNALQEANRAVELAPSSPNSYLALAHVQRLKGDQAGAEGSYKTALKANADSMELRLALGDLYIENRHWADAQRMFQQAIQLFPKRAQPRVGLVYLYLQSGDRAKALQTALDTKQLLKNDPDAYRIVGDYYIAINDLKDAETEYRQLVKDHPRDYRLQRTFTQVLILRDKLAEASKLNDAYLNMFAGDIDALIQKAEIYTRVGRTDEAVSILRTVTAREPDNYLAHYHLGLALRMERDFAGAEREMKEAARLQPDSTEPQVALADIAARRGNMDLLYQTSLKMLSEAPNSATGYVMRAMAEFSRDQRQAAEADLQKAIQIDPNNPLGYTKLAQFRLSQKKIPAAEDLLRQALVHAPGNADAVEVLASLLSSTGRLDQARTLLDEQIAKVPNRAALWTIKGQVLMRAAQYKDAETAFRKATELNQLDGDAWLWLGRAQNAQNNRNAVIATYEQWSQADPYDARSYMMLADLVSSDWQRARDLYRKALQLDPDNALAANNLAYLLLEHGGDPDDALAYATMARSQMPDSPVVLDTLGYAYVRHGDYKVAITVLTKAAAAEPSDPGIRYHLGLAYQKVKDWQRARQSLEKALQLDPNFPAAADVRKALAQVDAQKTGEEATQPDMEKVPSAS